MSIKNTKKWMTISGGIPSPSIIWYKLETIVEDNGILEFEFSADETCQIFLDGKIVFYGPGHSAKNYWLKQKCSLQTTSGKHLITVRLLALGNFSAQNQLSIKNGFYCTLEGNWQYQIAQDISYTAPWPDWGNFARLTVGGSYNYAAQYGEGNWLPVEYYEDLRELHDSNLPQLIGKEVFVQSIKDNLITFEDYECLWSTWHFSGTGTVSISWSETGYLTRVFSHHNLKGEKGRRDGKFFVGTPDTYTINGNCSFTDIQWRSGRHVKITCTGTAKVEKVEFLRTGYPYNYTFNMHDIPEKYQTAVQMAQRTLECCSHDLFMDCPYYERLMYIGDARIEALCAYTSANDSIIARKALKLFALTQMDNGAILSRFPAKVNQMIPSFVAIFILMVHDFMIWVDDQDFILEIMPQARKAADYLISTQQKDGLIYPPGWNFIDWQWPQRGVPFGSECGTNSILNLMAALALKKLANLEEYCNNLSNAILRKKQSEEIFHKVKKIYFNEETGLFADDKEQKFYSEHAQVLAMLIQDMPQLWDNIKNVNKMTCCGIYFSHYYLEAARQYNREQEFEDRLLYWCDLKDLGLKTLPEDFTNPRSDCHAWSSHILYHLLCKTGKAVPKCQMQFKY
jgi:hypothetical protein